MCVITFRRPGAASAKPAIVETEKCEAYAPQLGHCVSCGTDVGHLEKTKSIMRKQKPGTLFPA